jgi:hypothetical protein
MAGVRFVDLQSRPTAFLDVTSLTLEELQPLVPPFEVASPLWPMTGPHGVASAPKTLLHRRHVGAARQRTIRSKMSGWSTPGSRSFVSVRPLQGAGMIRALPPPPRIPCPPGAGCDRLPASWRSRSLRGDPRRSRSHAARSSRGSSTWLTRRCTSGGGASRRSTGVASAAASAKTGSACGSRVAATSCWTSAVRSITFGGASRPGNRWLNRDKLN